MCTEAPPTTTTRRGTPCARSWDPDWIARVEQREDELDHRVCGARTIGHAPCPAPSAHPTGRCGHHGGFALTGAPDGNRNASTFSLEKEKVEPKEIDVKFGLFNYGFSLLTFFLSKRK